MHFFKVFLLESADSNISKPSLCAGFLLGSCDGEVSAMNLFDAGAMNVDGFAPVLDEESHKCCIPVLNNHAFPQLECREYLIKAMDRQSQSLEISLSNFPHAMFVSRLSETEYAAQCKLC